MSLAGGRVAGASADYVYVESRGAHGHHAVGIFDAFVGSHREIWIGSDGSGLIRETHGPVSFFTEAGRAQWEAAGSPDLEGSGIDLFAPGCLGRARARLAALPSDRAALASALTVHSPLTLHDVSQLLGEALVEPEFRAVYELAAQLPDVEVLPAINDQLGRNGHGLRRIEDGSGSS